MDIAQQTSMPLKELLILQRGKHAGQVFLAQTNQRFQCVIGECRPQKSWGLEMESPNAAGSFKKTPRRR